MKKTDKNKIEEFIRVDHAGERGAIKIYEGQLLALNTFVKDDKLKEKTISCKDVTFRILGLSLATINTLISLLFSVITIKIFLNYEKNK